MHVHSRDFRKVYRASLRSSKMHSTALFSDVGLQLDWPLLLMLVDSGDACIDKNKTDEYWYKL